MHSANQVLDQRSTRPEEEPEEEEEVSEHKATFLDALKILGAGRKCRCQSDTEKSIIVMCNRVENELYRPEAQEKTKPKNG
jgi:hypothetical protein